MICQALWYPVKKTGYTIALNICYNYHENGFEVGNQ